MSTLIKKFIIFKKIIKKLNKDHISEYAAECAYFTILSFIPFIMLFLTLIQFTNIDKSTLYFWIRGVVPTNMVDLILDVIDEVYSKSVGTISITLIFALWSASRGFYYLSKGLRTIYNVKKEKLTNFIRLEGLLYTVVFIIALIAFLVIMVFGKKIHNIFLNYFNSLSFITEIILKSRGFVLIISMFFICLVMYKFIPKHKQKMKTQIYGSAFVAIAWYVTSWFFSIYFTLFTGFSNTYGSLTSIMLIMLWVYVCMYIILLGGEINYFVNEYKDSIRKNKFTNNIKNKLKD
jgi:membrane protein